MKKLQDSAAGEMKDWQEEVDNLTGMKSNRRRGCDNLTGTKSSKSTEESCPNILPQIVDTSSILYPLFQHFAVTDRPDNPMHQHFTTIVDNYHN